MPKPCWTKLADDPKACGSSEPTLLALWSKYRNQTRWPGYRNFSLGPDGPAPWPVLARRGSDRLCMTSWRAKYEARSAVGFQRCPQRRTYADGQGYKHAPKFFEWEVHGTDDSLRIVPKMAPHMCLSAPGLPVIPDVEAPTSKAIEKAYKLKMKMKKRVARHRMKRGQGMT